MSSKTWTYRKLTQECEEQLESFAQCAAETNDREEVRIYRCMANGAWSLWNRITGGWQIDDANKRLQAICDSVGKRPTVAEDSTARFQRRERQIAERLAAVRPRALSV